MIGAVVGLVAAFLVAIVGLLLVRAIDRATRRRPFRDAIEALVAAMNAGSIALPDDGRLVAQLCSFKPGSFRPWIGDTSPDMVDAIMLAFESEKRSRT